MIQVMKSTYQRMKEENWVRQEDFPKPKNLLQRILVQTNNFIKIPLTQKTMFQRIVPNSEINMFHITCPVICSMDEEPSSPSLIYKNSLNDEHLPNGVTPSGRSNGEPKEDLPSTSTDICIPINSDKTSTSVSSDMSAASIVSPTLSSLQQGMSPSLLRSQDQLILLASSSPQQGHIVHVYLLSPSNQRPEESVGDILTEGE
ncbi:uncharacterized protein LOC143233771 [Tachypleus tridentatus]|uniref:uncharacterized protein LOC143233771 n=1 Tax=Tachypleus tridentatus TaxID=6853 RepID=UPI003FD19D60